MGTWLIRGVVVGGLGRGVRMGGGGVVGLQTKIGDSSSWMSFATWISSSTSISSSELQGLGGPMNGKVESLTNFE